MHNSSTTSGERASKTVAKNQLSRRRLLAASTTIGIVGVAGCTQVANYIAEQILEDVNLFNETDQRVTGSITVTGPDESTVLDESFSVEPDTDDDEGDEESGATYADVFIQAGSYTVSVELDEPIEDEPASDAMVTVGNPDDEHIIVVFGSDDLDDAIDVFVIEEFSDISEYIDD